MNLRQENLLHTCTCVIDKVYLWNNSSYDIFFQSPQNKTKRERHKNYSSAVKIRKQSIILMASCNFLTNHLNSLNKCLSYKFEYCLIVAEHPCTSF